MTVASDNRLNFISKNYVNGISEYERKKRNETKLE